MGAPEQGSPPKAGFPASIYNTCVFQIMYSNDITFVHTSQNGRLFSNVSVACSYLRQGMMTKRSTHAFKRVMVTVNDVTGGEVLYE